MVLPPVIFFFIMRCSPVFGGEPIASEEVLSILTNDLLPLQDFHHLWFLYYLVWMVVVAGGIAYGMERRGVTLPRLSRWLRATFESLSASCGIHIPGGLNFLWFTLAEWSDGPTGSQWLPIQSRSSITLSSAFGWGLYVGPTLAQRLSAHGRWC